ncbi:ATP-binding protein [Escherichia coli]|uniref:ATP-binding protein n=1 Tax=Escherichia coli TaxID=562 RepID=UPI003B9A4A65
MFMTMTRHCIFRVYFHSKRKHNSIKLYRPFLNISRFECTQFCEFWNFPIRPDRTNIQFSYKRNRIRLQFLPYIQYFFNTNLFQKIVQIQKIITRENKYFDRLINKLYPCEFHCFFYYPKILQYRIVHNFLLLFKRKISFNEIDLILCKIFKFYE